MQRALDVISSHAATLLRAPGGIWVGRLGPRPDKPLILYDFESCPFCQKVREALTALDLEADVLPCPKRGHRFRDELVRRGGKSQFPYLVDPNTGKEMYESDDIVDYLFEQYGDGRPPISLRGPWPIVRGALGSLVRRQAGTFAQPSRTPEKPLELWSFEASPYCRIVREKLCVLELPYRLHNVAKGSPSREAFVAISGKMQVPYLRDPNTGKALFESGDIVEYLDETYAA